MKVLRQLEMCFARSFLPQVDTPEQLTHLIVFESITGTLTCTTALHTSGWRALQYGCARVEANVYIIPQCLLGDV